MRQLVRRISLSVLGLALLLPAPASSQLASLISDPVTEDFFNASPGSEPRNFVLLGRRAVFTASHPQLGNRLWATDGTPEGTELLGDICSGCGSLFSSPTYLGSTQSRLFFTVDSQLWATDGTRRGTVPLLPEGAGTGSESEVVGNFLFFLGRTPDTGSELWASDGTPAGTRLVQELVPGSGSAFPRHLAALGGRVYFVARTDDQEGLWASDGTAAGTEQVLVFPFAGSAFLDSSGLTSTTDHLFFYVRDFATRTLTLWASDGTAAGTREVMRLPGRPSFEPSTEHQVLGNRIFFLWHDGSHGIELWSSDGTPSGTVRITNFGPESPFPYDFSQSRSAVVRLGARVFFITELNQGHFELWATEADRIRLSPIAELRESDDCSSALSRLLVATPRHVFYKSCEGFTSSLWSITGQPESAVRIASGLEDGGRPGVYTIPGATQEVFFVHAAGRDGNEIFSTDGTVAGTRQRTRLPGLGFGFPGPFPFSLSDTAALLPGVLLFGASDEGPLGRELWAAQEGPESTRLVADLAPANASSRPQDPVEVLAGALFLQSTADGEPALWQTSGDGGVAEIRFRLSEVGCHRFQEVRLTRSGPRIFLLCNVGSLGDVVMVTDGTVAGTQPLLQTGWNDPDDLEFAELGDSTYVGGGTDGSLLRTDGSPGGSEQFLSAIDLGGPGVSQLTAIGDELYFVGEGRRVFRTDGTESDTSLLVEVDYFSLVGFWALEDGVHFLASQDFTAGIWRTDGTPEGTHQAVDLDVLDLDPPRRPETLVVLGSHLYLLGRRQFSSNDVGLWKTDGSQAGTVLLRGGFGDQGYFDLDAQHRLKVVGDLLYFAAREDDHGEELWRSDGTPEGTVLVADLQPGPASSRPRELTVARDRLFFAATGGAIGNELWVTDGTPGGTRLVQDVAPGLVPSSPQQLTVAGSHLLFSADDDLHGRELWSLPLDETGCVATGQALCLADGRFRVEAGWRDFQGNRGRGAAVPLTADTGTFWFFDPANVEVVLKVLDGRPLNEHFWTFYGALSSVEYQLTITDATTGVARRYANASGNLASRADTESFGPNGASLERYVLAREAGGAAAEVVRVDSLVPRGGSCAPSSERLCLAGGRFALEATWRDFAGNQGVGMAVALSGDTGYFWFFADTNVEVVAKVLDGTALNGRHWVFYGALSSVEYTLTVTDTETGAVRSYRNAPGTLASVADTGAF